MKSRIGLKPNGILLLKKPERHFEENDYIKTLDNWAKSIKDNPVADFTAKIKIKQIHSFPIYQVHSLRKYENRGLTQKREYANPSKYPRVPGRNWNNVNAWDYNIAEKEQAQNIVLEDTVYSENCNCCNAAGYIITACRTCAGTGHVTEERYKNDRTYHVNVHCYSCGGSGKQKDTCDVCAGYGGFVNYVVCHVAYEYPAWGTRYAANSVQEIGAELSWSEGDFENFEEVKTAKDFANFVEGDIREKSIADLITFINSNDSQNQHFLREVTQYSQTYVSFIHFEYEEGGEYTVVTYGEKGKVYAPDSPVSNCVDNLLFEAEQCIQQKDIKSTVKILKHIDKMNQKNNVINIFVNKFLEQAGFALEKISHHKGLSESRRIEIKRAAYELKANISKLDLFSFKFETVAYFIIPLLATIAYTAYSHQIQSGPDLEYLINKSTYIFMASTTTFAIQYIINRKKDIYFKNIWKYLIHGLIANFALTYFISTAKGFTDFVIGSLFITVVQYGITSLVEKYFNESHKSFSLRAFNNPVIKMEVFIESFSDELSDVESLLSTDIRYLDQETQNEFIQKARILENISKENSLNEEISYFKSDKKTAA